jgi:hypothetical protein
MSKAPLLTDSLVELLPQFPSVALRAVIEILKVREPVGILSHRCAMSARAMPPDADMKPFAVAIAEEVLWWADSYLRIFGHAPTWRDVVADIAKRAGVPSNERSGARAVWQIEGSLILAMTDALKGPEGQDLLRARSDAAVSPAKISATISAEEGPVARVLAPFADYLRRAMPPSIAGEKRFAPLLPLLPLLALPQGGIPLILLHAYHTAGPAYGIIDPVTKIIALTRLRMRIDALRSSFED